MKKFCVIYIKKKKKKTAGCYLANWEKNSSQLGRIRDRDLFSTALVPFCIIHRSTNVFARRNRRKYSNSKSRTSFTVTGQRRFPQRQSPPETPCSSYSPRAFLSLVFFRHISFCVSLASAKPENHEGRERPPDLENRISLTCLRPFVSRHRWPNFRPSTRNLHRGGTFDGTLEKSQQRKHLEFIIADVRL